MGIVCGITCVLNVVMSGVAGMVLKSVWKKKKFFLFSYTQLYFQYKKTGEKTSPNLRNQSKGH